MSDYKWIKTDRGGMCASCHTQLQSGNDVLWSLVDKSKVWCRKCGEQFQPYQEEPKEENKSKESSSTATTYTCDLCHCNSLWVSYHYTKDSERYCLCDFCTRVIECQHMAKIAGLWVVYRHPAIVEPKEIEKP